MSGARADEVVATPEPGVYYVNGQTWSVRSRCAHGEPELT